MAPDVKQQSEEPKKEVEKQNSKGGGGGGGGSKREEQESVGKLATGQSSTTNRSEAADKRDGEPSANRQQSGGRKSRKSKKKKKNKTDLSDPMKIIRDVLEKSSFKVANLSQLVEAQFYEDPGYKKEVRHEISDIVYRSTVDKNGDCFADSVSILPSNFDGQVILSPSAIMSLPDIREKPPKRQRNWRKGKRYNNNNKNKNNNDNSNSNSNNNADGNEKKNLENNGNHRSVGKKQSPKITMPVEGNETKDEIMMTISPSDQLGHSSDSELFRLPRGVEFKVDLDDNR